MQNSFNSKKSTQKIAFEYLAKRGQKFEGFDFLRTICVIAIVAYKTRIFYIPEILIPSSFTYALSAYVLSGMIGALAVPVFLQMSLFLFYLKSEKTGLRYFIQKRLPRVISLYIFWVGSITVFEILSGGGFESIRGTTLSLKSFVQFIVSGNSTPYFFFFSLIFVTVLAEVLVLVFGRLENPPTKTTVSYYLLFLSSILIFGFSIIDPIINYTGIQIPLLNLLNNLTHWDYNPVNFLPYVFTAAITAQEYNEGQLERITKSLKQKLYFLLFLTAAFFTLEWTLTSKRLLIQVDQAPLDHYMRLSLVFGSWLLLYLALLSKRKIPAIIRFISGCSLGIYGFHVFFIFRRPLIFDNIIFMDNIYQAAPVLGIVAAFTVTLVGSIALTLLARQINFLRKFVSV
jgi:hypothetical protein